MYITQGTASTKRELTEGLIFLTSAKQNKEVATSQNDKLIIKYLEQSHNGLKIIPRAQTCLLGELWGAGGSGGRAMFVVCRLSLCLLFSVFVRGLVLARGLA